MKVTDANIGMAKFTYVRQPAASDQEEPKWIQIEHSTPATQ